MPCTQAMHIMYVCKYINNAAFHSLILIAKQFKILYPLNMTDTVLIASRHILFLWVLIMLRTLSVLNCLSRSADDSGIVHSCFAI